MSRNLDNAVHRVQGGSRVSGTQVRSVTPELDVAIKCFHRTTHAISLLSTVQLLSF